MDLWCVSLPASDNATTVVSAAERRRAQRFRFAPDRDRYLAARATLRHLLASYLTTPAAEIALAENEHGKPRLAGRSEALEFNQSSVAKLTVYAISNGAPVGIDIEDCDLGLDVRAFSHRCLTAAERRWVDGLPTASQARACITLWTRKEALLKGIGTGLAIEPDRVETLPGHPPRWHSGEPLRWSVLSFAGPGQTQVALAIHDRPETSSHNLSRCAYS